MKLFVWNELYQVDWGGSCLYVVAETEAQARALAPDAIKMRYGKYSEETYALPNLGPPTRILDVPCAEIYEWSE